MDYPEQNYNSIVDTLINTFGEVLSRDVLHSIVESFEGNLEESANAVMNIAMDDNNTKNAAPDFNQVNEYLVNEFQQAGSTVFPNYMVDTGSADQNTKESEIANNLQAPLTYAKASRSSKQPSEHRAPQVAASITPNRTQFYRTEQLRQILSYHENGARTLIVMRGLPGSGKTYLARKIVDAIYHTKNQHYHIHIFSTDDYFMRNGVYVHDKSKLQEAHEWNQKRAKEAITAGVSPVIVDNTNIEFWEMEFYVVQGVRNGYIIEVVEPNTPWAKKASQLSRKTTHNVPVALIRKKLENFQSGVDGDYLMNLFKLFYIPCNKPPVLRTIPPFSREESMNLDNLTSGNASISETSPVKEIQENYHEIPQCSLSETTVVAPVIKDFAEHPQPHLKISAELTEEGGSNSESSTFISSHLDKFVEIQKCLEEMERVEKEWENGEDWDNSSKNKGEDSKSSDFINSKPQRQLNKPVQSDTTEKLSTSDGVYQDWSRGSIFLPPWGESSQNTQIEPALPIVEKVPSSVCIEYGDTDISTLRNKPMQTDSTEKLVTTDKVCQDWSKFSMYLPSWEENCRSTQVEPPQSVIEKKTSSTCIEYGDTDISSSRNPYKIVKTTPRNINEYHITVNQKKMPVLWMLDKSTSTNNNEILTDNFRCKNEEQHFAAFRKLFKNIARSDLRDIFDNCCGDVNWAVEIVLDGVASKQLDIVDSREHSDTEEEAQDDNLELCQCLSAYDIIPHNNDSSSPLKVEESENLIDNAPSSSRSKGKKENLSKISMQLKRQIEQNVVISDNHYSAHCLKIRKFRRGELGNFSDYNDGIPLINQQNITETSEVTDNENVVSSSLPDLPPSTSRVDNIHSEMSDEDSPVFEDIEKTVNINLGKEFVVQLDEIFGRRNMNYPPTVIPKINMPLSLLNEINALWMESLMNQLEEDAKQSEIMLQQDEEFARQLVIKEAEMIQAGKEPEVPDFKEIMDMDFALSLYHKDIAEWRNSMPDDMAAKLTRDKLYNLFPEVSKDVLSELLMAHDNNFQQTVEGLLISTGKTEILEMKNGVSKFVMEKEMERQERLLEEQRQAVSEVEWPLIQTSEPVDMTAVQHYRDEAEKHLKSRNMNYQRAQEYIRRGITQVATHYSEIAAFHKKKYEIASSMAAATLMQVHAANCSDNATIDLHYLRVAEARESLDLFIDTHIQKLRETQDRNGVKSHTLFFITGRGLHSNGRPRVKPAVKKRLAERGLAFSERNPGLLTAKVCADDKLSHQVA